MSFLMAHSPSADVASPLSSFDDLSNTVPSLAANGVVDPPPPSVAYRSYFPTDYSPGATTDGQDGSEVSFLTRELEDGATWITGIGIHIQLREIFATSGPREYEAAMKLVSAA